MALGRVVRGALLLCSLQPLHTPRKCIRHPTSHTTPPCPTPSCASLNPQLLASPLLHSPHLSFPLYTSPPPSTPHLPSPHFSSRLLHCMELLPIAQNNSPSLHTRKKEALLACGRGARAPEPTWVGWTCRSLGVRSPAAPAQCSLMPLQEGFHRRGSSQITAPNVSL